MKQRLTQNVYDSPTGRILLVPQGTRIIGQYDSGVGFGQRRVLLVWNRLIMPDGRSIVLERQTVCDPVRLIVPMLERFVASDRGFARARREAAG